MKLKRVAVIQYHWNVENSDLKNDNWFYLDEIAEKTIFEKRLQGFSGGDLTTVIDSKTITGQWTFMYNYKKTGLKRL